MSTTTTTGENKSEESDRMGVASLSSNKRRLENPDDGDEDYVIAAKVAKKATPVYVESAAEVQDTIGHENSSDFLTTSILARTLLTSTVTGVTSQLSYSPLESLSSTLEALPAPSLLMDTGSESEIRSTFLPFKTTIQEATELEFTSLLCHERTLSTVTVLSPIDEDSSDWSSVVSSGTCASGPNGSVSDVRQTSKIPNGGGCTISTVSDQQVITEDETGKSYFNLGSADTTLLVKKSPPTAPSANHHQNPLGHNNNNSNNNHNNNQIPVVTTSTINDQSWINGCNNSTDFIDDGSSSSCESISSEDLFTSEEFDASEDEEEIRTYKQQRSTVLHISLCKLNSFRTQQCVEPSLHRSVLICNTLRHIEQEIRSEDEIPMRSVGRGGGGGGNNQPLPPFWASSPNQNPNGNGNGNNSQSSSNNTNSMIGGPTPVLNQPQMTDIRPNQPHVASLHGHDPYLPPLPNSYNGSAAESPYSTYDYNSLRPNPTPFHTATYDYTDQDLSLVSGSPGTAQILDVSSPPSLLECDSGYAEDLNLSSYYYNTNTPPGPLPPGPPRPGTPRNGSSTVNVNVNSHSIPVAMETSSSEPVNSNVTTNDSSSYLNCGYNSLNLGDVSSVVAGTGADALLSDTSSLLSSTSDMSDIEMHSSLASPAVAAPVSAVIPIPSSVMPPLSGGVVDSRTAGSSCDYNNLVSSSSNSESSSNDSSSSSDNSLSPPPQMSELVTLTNCTTGGGAGAVNPPIVNNSASSPLCWSKTQNQNSNHLSTNGGGGSKEMIPLNNSTNSLQHNPSNSTAAATTTTSPAATFIQQDSHQCGMESRLSEFSRSHSNFTNPHHHNLPMDSLISANYSNSL